MIHLLTLRAASRMHLATGRQGLVPPAGIEPATCPLGKGCSIQLSYGGLAERSYLLARGLSSDGRAEPCTDVRRPGDGRGAWPSVTHPPSGGRASTSGTLRTSDEPVENPAAPGQPFSNARAPRPGRSSTSTQVGGGGRSPAARRTIAPQIASPASPKPPWHFVAKVSSTVDRTASPTRSEIRWHSTLSTIWNIAVGRGSACTRWSAKSATSGG